MGKVEPGACPSRPRPEAALQQQNVCGACDCQRTVCAEVETLPPRWTNVRAHRIENRRSVGIRPSARTGRFWARWPSSLPLPNLPGVAMFYRQAGPVTQGTLLRKGVRETGPMRVVAAGRSRVHPLLSILATSPAQYPAGVYPPGSGSVFIVSPNTGEREC